MSVNLKRNLKLITVLMIITVPMLWIQSARTMDDLVSNSPMLLLVFIPIIAYLALRKRV
jgi:hypothetical protein